MTCEIIAEAGVNHNGSIDLAKGLIDIAAEAGADVVKFQTFAADRLVSSSAKKGAYQQKTTGSEGGQLEMLRRLELKESDYATLLSHCERKGITFLSTPFDLLSAIFLVRELGLTRIKIPSGEVTNLPYLVELGRLGSTFILSTGMCCIGDVELALGALAFGKFGSRLPPSPEAFIEILADADVRAFLRASTTILHCTTEYPAPIESVNLRAMTTLGQAFDVPYGFSDHTEGVEIPVAAAALGATIIEKHFTSDRDLPGPDHKASLEPSQLKLMIQMIRNVSTSLGSPLKFSSSAETANKKIARKVILAARPILSGAVIKESDLSIKRSAKGLSPAHFWDIVESKAVRNFAVDEPIVLQDDK